jgi:transcriptional regulator with XRE-family HTH domain
MTVGEHLAHRLRDLRTNYNNGEGVSQETLAKELEVAPNTISRWETGVYCPSIGDLEKLARFFGVSIKSFFPADGMESVDNDLLSLLRAAKHLNPDDLEELIKYAEFRRARQIYKGRSRPKAGRKSRKK